MSYPRPKSPNMQNYRPQLTSVMSFGHRLSGVALALFAFGRPPGWWRALRDRRRSAARRRLC